jgi:hypothetical protein
LDKNKNSTGIYIPNMQNFRIWATIRPLFEIKYKNVLYGPSIYDIVKNCINIG